MATAAGKVVTKAVALPIKALSYTAGEPLLSGGLLYLLTRAPADIRERALAPLRSNVLAKNPNVKIAQAITLLKALLALGIYGRVSQLLNRLARNYWYIRNPSAPWRFGDAQKSELVFITGASSGFGYEMVKSFATKARVIALDISDFPPELERLRDVHFYKCDVTDFDALIKLCGEIKRTHGDPSVLINNAGIANGKLVLETPAHAVDRLMKVNLTSHFLLIKEFVPGMLAARKGHVVTIASMASFVAAPGLLDYCCSKVGALYLNDGLRAELMTRHGSAGHTIRTTSVHPSWHSTGLVKPAEPMLNKYGIFPDPASNVSDLIVNQVLAGRSGQIFVPKDQERYRNARSWPLWVQDVLAGYPWSKGEGAMERFRFGDPEGKGAEGISVE